MTNEQTEYLCKTAIILAAIGASVYTEDATWMWLLLIVLL